MPFTTRTLIEPISENGLRTTWKVIEPINFQSERFNYPDGKHKNYVVPAGEITDLASGFMTAASAAAIVHDHLYGDGTTLKQVNDRKEADLVFFEAMLASGVPSPRAWTYYYAVRMFGRRFYKPGS